MVVEHIEEPIRNFLFLPCFKNTEQEEKIVTQAGRCYAFVVKPIKVGNFGGYGSNFGFRCHGSSGMGRDLTRKGDDAIASLVAQRGGEDALETVGEAHGVSHGRNGDGECLDGAGGFLNCHESILAEIYRNCKLYFAFFWCFISSSMLDSCHTAPPASS